MGIARKQPVRAVISQIRSHSPLECGRIGNQAFAPTALRRDETSREVLDKLMVFGDLNELLGTDFDTEADSVGGLFTEVAGRIPAIGESVDIEGVRFTVTELQGTRICQLSVEPTTPNLNGFVPNAAS